LPAGFTRAVFREEPCKLELVTNPSQRILPGVIENALSILSEGVFYAQRVFGEDMRDIVLSASGDEINDLSIAETSVRVRHDVERVVEVPVPARDRAHDSVQAASARRRRSARSAVCTRRACCSWR
jgi:hypothetical protein